MNGLSLSALTKTAKVFIRKHTAEILIGIGTAGMVTTAVMTGCATVKAVRLLNEREKENNEKLSKKEAVKSVWTCFIPPICVGTVSVACIIFASSVNLRRNTALATALELSQTALSSYKTKVTEIVGEKKEQTIKDAVAKDIAESNQLKDSEVIITDRGNTLCLDYYSGRYFKSDIENIRRAINRLNELMLKDGYILLNEFYYEIGLDGIAIGEELGWNINKGIIELSVSAQVVKNGQPCLVIGFENAPRYDCERY